MASLRPANIAATGRDKLFWAAIAALLVGQLLAFWMLCRQQVLNAAAREAVVQVERVAMADCLRHIPRATASSCAARTGSPERLNNAVLAADDRASDAGGVLRASMSSAVPMNFTLR